jgi:acetyltransferase-like isoleucine patch superfamily enzyme
LFFRILVALVPKLRLLDKIEQKFNGELTNVELEEPVKLYPPNFIAYSRIGKYSYISERSYIYKTTIGRFCSVGPGLLCGWGIHPTNGISTSPMFYSTKKQNGFSLSAIDKIDEIKQVTIGNDVFIGANVTILNGVIVGDGAVIGAGCVVSKDVPPYSIAVGSPMRIIKKRFDENQIEALLKIKWWDWQESDFNKVEEYFFRVDEFINRYV